jgi:hypothetical protein
LVSNIGVVGGLGPIQGCDEGTESETLLWEKEFVGWVYSWGPRSVLR